MHSKPFFKGVPVEPDVKRLIDAFPPELLAPGATIGYADVERIINQDRGSNRFYRITKVWREKMKLDHSVIIKPPDVPDNTFRVLKEGEKVDYSANVFRSAIRKTKKSLDICVHTDVKQLQENELRTYNFLMTRNSKIIASAQLRSNRNILSAG
jgi:hypothetical protein